CYQYRSGYSF
nr:immunoglobulin light chain junction region [Macaca mulatta]MOW11997.1 immunoglobulin light chain junction region [Macaca mulatta]MOW12451.1 immunoglobulin light chain junction region [Macaca mulatta]